MLNLCRRALRGFVGFNPAYVDGLALHCTASSRASSTEPGNFSFCGFARAYLATKKLWQQSWVVLSNAQYTKAVIAPCNDSGMDCRRSPGTDPRQCRGAALRLARSAYRNTNPELLRQQRCRLLVLTREVGGHWSPEAAQLVRTVSMLCQQRSLGRQPCQVAERTKSEGSAACKHTRRVAVGVFLCCPVRAAVRAPHSAS